MSIMEHSEKLLIEQLRLGNDRAYRYLFDHHYTVLCRVAYRYVCDMYIAESLADDLIVHLWEQRESLTINVSLRSYLLAAIRNRCITYLRSSEQKVEVNFSQLEQHEQDSLNSIANTDFMPMDEQQLVQTIQVAIDRLPEECRKVFMKSREEEMSYDAIAAELGISVNTVKYHIKNALRSLRQELGPYLTMMIFLIFF